jgi:hypothetical protein
MSKALVRTTRDLMHYLAFTTSNRKYPFRPSPEGEQKLAAVRDALLLAESTPQVTTDLDAPPWHVLEVASRQISGPFHTADEALSEAARLDGRVIKLTDES